MTKVRIQLHDEAPRLGSGHRTVEVLSVGYKWVMVRCPFTQVRHRFKRAFWDTLMASVKAPQKA